MATPAKPLAFSFNLPSTSNTNTGTGATTTTSNPFSFGNASTSTNQPTSSLFGSTNPSAPSTNTFSGFGSLAGNAQSNQPANNANNSQFTPFQSIAPKPPLTVSQLFPSSSSSLPSFGQSTSNMGGFGSSTVTGGPGASTSQATSFFLPSASAQPSSLSASSSTSQQPPLSEQIGGIANSWNPASNENKFLFYLYNLAPSPLTTPLSSLPLPPQVAASPRLANLYKQAVLESPRPKEYLPVLASSFDDLQKRVEVQKSTAAAHLGKLQSKDVKGKIQDANKKHWNETLIRIERLTREQIKIEQRLVRMCAKLAGLHISPSSSADNRASIAKDESDTLLLLERTRNELNGHIINSSKARGTSMGTHRLANIVSELWMVVSQRRAATASNGRMSAPDSGHEYRVTDQSELNKVLEVLAQQQKSLDYLSRTIRTLCVDIDTARNGFGLPWLYKDDVDSGNSGEASRGMVLG